jgi:hypothetical protein
MSEDRKTTAFRPRSNARLLTLLGNGKTIRWLLASLIGCITIIVIATRGYELLSIRIDRLPDLPYSDLIEDLIDIKRDQSGKLFDAALLLLGALFALMIAKKDEARIILADYPEVIMFVAASALLLASLACDITYLGVMSDSLYTGGRSGSESMPDIFGTAFEKFYTAQIIFLVGGVLAAAATLISAHRLKEVTEHA